MRKDEYRKYINPSDFEELYIKWSSVGKPQGNNPLYVKIWDGVENSVKAVIGALQSRYHCQYQNYNEKIMDGTILIMEKLLKMTDTPRNIVSMCYLPVLGLCCGQKAINEEKEDNALSMDNLTEGNDTFCELMYLDEDGTVQYGYVNY